MMGVKKNAGSVPEDVRGEIETLLCDRFGLTEKRISENAEGNFFGVRGLLKSRELTYLAYLLEMRYDIRFGMEEYDDQRFYSLPGLSELVSELVSKRCGEAASLFEDNTVLA